MRPRRQRLASSLLRLLWHTVKASDSALWGVMMDVLRWRPQRWKKAWRHRP